MTAKEYLEQVRRNETIVRNLRLDLQNAEEMATSIKAISYDHERVQKSRNVNVVAEMVERIEEKKETLSKKLFDALEYRLTVTNEINQLQDERFSEVLYRRYIQFQDWALLGSEMGYNTRYVQQLNGGALVEFYEMFKDIHGFTGIDASDKGMYRKKGNKE